MSTIQTISVRETVAYSEGFLKARREKRLSKLTNDLWETHFNIEKQEIPNKIIEIDDELREVAAKKALLLDKKKTLEKEAKEEEKRYTIIE